MPPVFFQTFRGKVMHIQGAGVGWSRLCSLRTARAGEVFNEVVELGSFEMARTQGRPFCKECLSRAGLEL